MAKIAGNMGISRARVTQVMNLLNLPDEIITHVCSLTTTKDSRFFSERRLRRILSIADNNTRLAAYRQLCHQVAL
jgi:hypothetical protein